MTGHSLSITGNFDFELSTNNGELCTWFDKLEFFFFFPFIEKLYPPVSSMVPASLQAQVVGQSNTE